MASIQIPNLTAATSVSGAEQMEAVQGGSSVRVTIQQIADLAGSQYGLTPIPDLTLLGNLSGVSALPTNYTLSQFLDSSFSNTQGAILYRAGSSWQALAPGLSGQVLATNGTGADVSWFTIAGTGTVTSITAGTNLSVSGSANPITLAGTINTVMNPAFTTSVTTPSIYGGSSASQTLLIQSTTGVGTSDSIVFKVGNNGAITAMTIASDGTVTIPQAAIDTTSITVPLLIGGTTASSSLTLKSTSGVGTTDSILMKVGNNGAVTALTIASNGDATFLSTSTTTIGTLSLTNALTVGNGGTGATTLTLNGVLYGNATSAVGVTAAGTTGQVLVATTGSAPSWSSTIPSTAGVTSISFDTTGLTPSTATKGAITVAGTLVAANGGTGQSSYTIGDLLYASGTTALSKLADVAIGSVLVSGGVGTAPAYSSSPTISTSVTTPLVIGGTTASSSLTLQSTSGVGTTDSINMKVGNAGAINALSISSAGVVALSSALAATSGGTGQASYAVGDLLYADTTTSLAKLADVATGNALISGGVSTAPTWGKINLTTTISGTLPVANGGTGATTANAALTNLTTWTTTATASGTTVLTNTSTYFQFFTGTLSQTITLPVTSTLATGWTFHIVNNSTGNLTVNSSGGNLVITIIPGTTAMVTCQGTTLTTAADWESGYTDFSTATGTGSVVLSASPTLTGTTTATTLSATTLTATAGAGFQNMVVQTSGTSASYSLPAALQVTGAKFKVTVIGGGAGGGGTSTTAGQAGGGGGAGAVGIIYLTYVAGQNTLTYSVGAAVAAGAANAAGTAGNASSIIYNSLTYTAGGGTGGTNNGAGGAGGTTSGTAFTLSINGQAGAAGGTMAATSNYNPNGGDTPLGFGSGGRMSATAAGGAGSVGQGYGSGGSGARNGTGVTSLAGGGGNAGVVIIEY
jgi:hypothetical protein